MSIKATAKPQCEPVAEAELATSEISKYVLKPSEEFFQIFELSHTFINNRAEMTKKQIRTLEIKMKKLFQKVVNMKDTKLDDVITLAHVYLNLCNSYIQSKEKGNLHVAKGYLLDCMNLITDKNLDPKIIWIALKAYQYSAYIHERQKRIEEAVQTYNKVVKLYVTYTEKNNECNASVGPQSAAIRSSVSDYGELTKIYTSALYSLVELHMCMTPKNNHNIMIYRQLLLTAEFFSLPETKEYFKWIETAMKLCDYCFMYNRFKDARHHITAANYIQSVCFDEERDYIIKQMILPGEKKSLEVLKLHEQKTAGYALISIYRAKYEIALLRRSSERLLQAKESDDFETNTMESKSLKIVIPTDIESNQVQAYNPLSAKYVSSYIDAKKIFMNVLRVLNNVKLIIDSDKDAQTHTKIILHTSNAYKCMELYETNKISRGLLLKQRIDILSGAVMFSVDSRERRLLRYLRLQLAIAYATLIETELEEVHRLHALRWNKIRYNTIRNEINIDIDDVLKKGTINLKLCVKYC